MIPDAVLSRLRGAFRRHGEAIVTVRLFQGEDAVRDVAVERKKKRWDAVLAAMEKIGWSACELLARGGATLARVDNDGAATGIEDVSGAVASREDRLLTLLLRGQREALSFRDAETTAALRACVDVMREMGSAVTQLAGVYREQVRAVQEIAAMRPELPPGDPDKLESSKLLEAMLPALLPKILAALNPQPPAPVAAAAPPPNGARVKS